MLLRNRWEKDPSKNLRESALSKQALQGFVWVETSFGLRFSPPRCECIAFLNRERFRHPHAIRLTHRIRGLVDSAASFGQSITTASRSVVNRDDGRWGWIARTKP